MNRLNITLAGYVFGITSTIIGLIVRLCAYKWAFGSGKHIWGAGEWESTTWAFWQHTYRDLGMAMLAFGLALILICFSGQLREAAK